DLLDLEEQYDSDDIIYFRKCAVALLRRQLRDKPVMLRSAMPKENAGLFSSWFGGRKKKEEIEPVFVSEKEKVQLFFKVGCGEGITYDEAKNEQVPPDFNQIKVLVE
ncbi:hypothetical protein RFI_38427, partial [Reticulomyxa filosa]